MKVTQKAEIELRKELSSFREKSEELRQLILGLHISHSDILHAATTLNEVELFLDNVFEQRIIMLKHVGNN